VPAATPINDSSTGVSEETVFFLTNILKKRGTSTVTNFDNLPNKFTRGFLTLLREKAAIKNPYNFAKHNQS